MGGTTKVGDAYHLLDYDVCMPSSREWSVIGFLLALLAIVALVSIYGWLLSEWPDGRTAPSHVIIAKELLPDVASAAIVALILYFLMMLGLSRVVRPEERERTPVGIHPFTGMEAVPTGFAGRWIGPGWDIECSDSNCPINYPNGPNEYRVTLDLHLSPDVPLRGTVTAQIEAGAARGPSDPIPPPLTVYVSAWPLSNNRLALCFYDPPGGDFGCGLFFSERTDGHQTLEGLLSTVMLPNGDERALIFQRLRKTS